MSRTLLERWKSLDPMIVTIVAGLLIFGLMMLWSASGPSAFQRTGDGLFFVKRQLLRGIFPGMILFSLFAFIDLQRWKSLATMGFIASLILLILVYVPGIGQRIGGSLSWVQIGPISFQPSEFVKLSFMLYVAAWLANRKGRDAHAIETGLIPFLLALTSVVVLLIMQPDTGSMAVIASTALIMYFVSGAPIAWFVLLTAAGFGLVAFLIKRSAYRAARFMTFLHPELDPKGIGYHINQAILAIGSGGWLGLGYGHSRQKFLYLPEVESDSIIAIIAEELGLVMVIVLLIVFAMLIWRCFMISRQAKDRFGMYVAAGIGGWLAIQTIMNIASMSGLMPMTGVTLPFISYGGSSMIVLLGAMGLVASIPTQEEKPRLREK